MHFKRPVRNFERNTYAYAAGSGQVLGHLALWCRAWYPGVAGCNPNVQGTYAVDLLALKPIAIWELPQIRCTVSAGPYNKDPTM